jgi:hypothetical protein
LASRKIFRVIERESLFTDILVVLVGHNYKHKRHDDQNEKANRGANEQCGHRSQRTPEPVGREKEIQKAVVSKVRFLAPARFTWGKYYALYAQ